MVALVSSMQAGHANNKVSAWELVQISKLTGKHKVIIAPNAIKIISYGYPYVIVSKAPDWKVFTYNTRAKRIFESSLLDFEGRLVYSSNAFSQYLEQLPVRRGKVSKDIIFNQQCDKIHMINHGKDSKRPGTSNSYSPMLFVSSDLKTADFWKWNDSSLPMAASLILLKINRLPAVSGVPLRLVAFNFDREKRVELETESMKKVSVSDEDFAIPSGMKKTNSEIEMLNDSKRKQAVKNLIQSWDQWGKIIDTRKESMEEY